MTISATPIYTTLTDAIDCGSPLTSCWSTGNTARHPYYLCHKRGCASYGKSIRRERTEGEFETLLRKIQPSASLFNVATAMFKDLWNHRLTQAQAQAKAFAGQLAKIDQQVAQFLHRIVETNVPSIIQAYEERVSKLEADKLGIREKIASAGRPARSFDDSLRTALGFLANP